MVTFAKTSGIWWEELGRTTLGVAGDTITVSSLPARKYLAVKTLIIGTGSVNQNIRFNNDSGNNYAQSSFYNNAGSPALYNPTSASYVNLDSTNTNGISSFNGEILNTSTNSKVITGMASASNGAASAVSFPTFTAGKWVSNAIVNRIDIVNGSSGDFAAGSELVVLGRN